MKQYEYHSTLPPEDLKKELSRRVRVENILLDGQGDMRVKWKGMKLRLSRRSFSSGEYSGVEVRPFSVSASVGLYRSTWWENTFWGKIIPDAAGGSILQGCFIMPLWGIFILALVAVGVVWGLLMEIRRPFSWYSACKCGVLAAFLIHFAVAEHKSPTRPKQTLNFLERTFKKLEGE